LSGVLKTVGVFAAGCAAKGIIQSSTAAHTAELLQLAVVLLIGQ